MADLSGISENNIRALEEAMRVFGMSGITVDGNPEDLSLEQIKIFLDEKIGTAFGETGIDFAQGEGFDSADFLNPEAFDARMADIKNAVEGFNTSPHLQLVREIMSDVPDVAQMEQHLKDIGIPAPKTVAETIDMNLSKYSAEQILNLPFVGVIAQATANDPNFAKLRDILGDQAFDNIGQTLDVMNNADSWLQVLEAYKPEEPQQPVSAAEAAAAAAALDAQTDVAKEAQSTVEMDRIKAVEATLGIENPDGVWGAAEQAALKTRIAEMQTSDPTWVGRKDGVYTTQFAEYVAGNLPGFDNFDDTDKAFFAQLAGLRLDNVDLIAEADQPIEPEDVQAAIKVVEEGLQMLIPIVQGELDQKRADAEGLIDSIQGGRTSQMQRDAAEAKLRELSLKDEGTLTQKDLTDMEDAQAILNNRDIAGNIGNFVDDFLGLGYTTIGQRMVQAGKEWSVGMIRGQLAGISDLPPVESVNVDGHLDINEQTALQGVTYLLAKKFGIAGSENWRYTPDLGETLLKKIENLDDDEKLLLLSDDQRAEYDAKASDALRQDFLNEQFEAKKTQVAALLAAMDTLYEADVLVSHQLYHGEEIEIPEFTQEIFGDFIQDHQADPQALSMLNVMTYEFTQGLDLTAIMDADYTFPAGLSAVDPTQTIAERFQSAYQDGLDTQYMLEMLDTLPFGTDERRAEMKNIVEKANAAVQAKQEEDPDVTIAVLSAIYGNAMEAGINAMNDDPAMAPDYLFMSQRPITRDPRLGDTIHPDSSISVDAVFALHEKENDNFVTDNYKGTFFTDESGDIYLAAVDYVSKVFTIEKVDLEHWDRVVDGTPRQPGEGSRDYYRRLDEALSEVSGHDLIFQNNFEGLKQMTLVRGQTAATYPDYLRARSIETFDALNNRVNNDYESYAPARSAEGAANAVTQPDSQARIDVFRAATQGPNAAAPVDKQQEFREDGEAITAPEIIDGTQGTGGVEPAPSVLPHNNGR